MVHEGHVRRGHTGTFALLVVLAAVEGAISTWLAVKYHKYHNYVNVSIRDRTNFIAFTSWFTFIFAILYLAFFLHSAHGSIIMSLGSHAIFLFLIWVFWTAGAASITAAMGGGINCAKTTQDIVYCNQLNAEMGFAWACWVVVSWALIATLFFGVRARKHGEGWRGHFVA